MWVPFKLLTAANHSRPNLFWLCWMNAVHTFYPFYCCVILGRNAVWWCRVEITEDKDLGSHTFSIRDHRYSTHPRSYSGLLSHRRCSSWLSQILTFTVIRFASSHCWERRVSWQEHMSTSQRDISWPSPGTPSTQTLPILLSSLSDRDTHASTQNS